jgi:hypothetical protein
MTYPVPAQRVNQYLRGTEDGEYPEWIRASVSQAARDLCCGHGTKVKESSCL